MSIINQIFQNGNPAQPVTTPQDLSLKGQQGPNFENEGQRTTSDIQALVSSGNALDTSGTNGGSQDLIKGRGITRRGLGVGGAAGSYLRPPSTPPVSFPDAFVGRPYYPSLGGPYRDRGPADGRY